MTPDMVALWSKRVERFHDSDLTVAEYANEIGVDPMTLQRWISLVRTGAARVVSVKRGRAEAETRRCENPRCGRPFQPVKPTQRFCHPRCRQSVACSRWYRKTRGREAEA